MAVGVGNTYTLAVLYPLPSCTVVDYCCVSSAMKGLARLIKKKNRIFILALADAPTQYGDSVLADLALRVC